MKRERELPSVRPTGTVFAALMNSACEPNKRSSLASALADLIASTGSDHLGALLGEGDGAAYA
jgi:hypothetical protein